MYKDIPSPLSVVFSEYNEISSSLEKIDLLIKDKEKELAESKRKLTRTINSHKKKKKELEKGLIEFRNALSLLGENFDDGA